MVFLALQEMQSSLEGTKDMTPDKINTAIAEWMGWIYYDGWHHPNVSTCEANPPDFYHDLNECREAVNNLSPMDRQLFLTKICKHTPEKRRWIPVVIVEVLTDPQLICEYLLRTIGRWEA